MEMRFILYLFIAFALAARGVLFMFFWKAKSRRTDDFYFGIVFIALSLSYTLYASEALNNLVIPTETFVDVCIASVVVFTTVRAYLYAVKEQQNEGKK